MMRVFLICLLSLAGCGFAPAIDGEMATRLAQIKVLPIAERQGQALNTALRAELNPQGLKIGPAYELDVTLTTTLTNSFSSASGTYRARGLMQATAILRDLRGTQLWSGTVSRASLLSLGQQPTLNAYAEAALWDDLAKQVAGDLKLRLAAHL